MMRQCLSCRDPDAIELERTIAGGGSLDMGEAQDKGGGVWLNDLKALKEDIT